MSTLRLDHVVIAVPDLDAAMADYRALGFTVTPGGQHAGRLSHNALIAFDDGSYLELIAWRGPNDEPWYRTLQADGEGLVDWALWPDDIHATAAAARQRGLHSLGPVAEGGRLRPDGQAVRWLSARQQTRALPFLCADTTPRGLRVPEGEARRHANGVTGVAAVVVAVAQLDPAQQALSDLLGAPLADGLPDAVDAALPGLRTPDLRLAQIGLPGTDCTLALVAASEQATDADPAAYPGALRQRVQARGAGPCALVLHTRSGCVTLPALCTPPSAARPGRPLRRSSP